MNNLQFHALNLPPPNSSSSSNMSEPSSSSLSEFFTLNAQPGTSLWRAPQCQSVSTAPMLITCLCQPFLVAEVTVSADFDMEWDQGGLVIFAGSPPGGSPVPSSLSTPSSRRRRSRHPNSCDGDGDREAAACGKWVKAGLEFTGGMLNASSVVATSESGADWSLSPLFPFTPPQDAFTSSMPSLRIKFERIGDSLWIWYLVPGLASYSNPGSPESLMAEWRKLREVMGFFSGVEVKGGVWIGCYASRPMRFVPSHSWEDARPEANALVVEFEDLEIL